MSDNLALTAAEKTYGEVLDATTHQDDKIGRFFTGIAFLTTGAIAFGFRTEVVQASYDIGDSVLRLPLMCFVAFLLLVVATVLCLVLGLGPNLSAPKSERGSRERRSSSLFFLLIADETLREWMSRWETGEAGKDRDRRAEFAREAYNIAGKTNFKYGRTSEARAFFTLALLSLGLGVALAGYALARIGLVANGPKLADVQGIEWTEGPKTLAAVVIAGIAFGLTYDYFRNDQTVDRLVRRTWRDVAMLYGPVVSAPTAAALAVATPLPGTLANSLSIALTLLVFVATLPYTRRLDVLSVSTFVLWGATAVAGVLSAANEWEEWGLAAAIGVVLIVDLPRLLRSTDQWRLRRRRLERITDEVADAITWSRTAPDKRAALIADKKAAIAKEVESLTKALDRLADKEGRAAAQRVMLCAKLRNRRAEEHTVDEDYRKRLAAAVAAFSVIHGLTDKDWDQVELVSELRPSASGGPGLENKEVPVAETTPPVALEVQLPDRNLDPEED